ncbi:hypothetical protein HPB50_020976 [Hyalomma asiaticum]|uniref:Uncharacterized protein n=1 Tax=Hyalomma asiaticum TaxID=266040 RepID=A0ACB7T267_HYAAI|nr:hypothetical protein HPB50_020976 [Hyalomma asiaticum]
METRARPCSSSQQRSSEQQQLEGVASLMRTTATTTDATVVPPPPRRKLLLLLAASHAAAAAATPLISIFICESSAGSAVSGIETERSPSTATLHNMCLDTLLMYCENVLSTYPSFTVPERCRRVLVSVLRMNGAGQRLSTSGRLGK